MPIIVVGSSKGGCGKSTITTNLITMHQAKGLGSLLIDADPQRSSSNWVALRASRGLTPEVVAMEKTGADLKRSAVEMAKHYDHVFIDAPGHNSPELRASLVVADVLLYPVKPSNFDAWVFHQDFEDLISNVRSINEGLKVMVVMNGLSPSPAWVARRRARAWAGDHALRCQSHSRWAARARTMARSRRVGTARPTSARSCDPIRAGLVRSRKLEASRARSR